MSIYGSNIQQTNNNTNLLWNLSLIYLDHLEWWIDDCLLNVVQSLYSSSICYSSDVVSLFASADESLEKGKILEFLEQNKFPLVITLNELNSVKVYSTKIKFQVSLYSLVYVNNAWHIAFILVHVSGF